MLLLQKKIFFFLPFIFILGCNGSSRFSAGSDIDILKNTPSYKIDYNKYSKNKVIKSFEGLASFYAHKYHGRTTSNGETYNMYELTAAHPYFPFETIVRIVNLENDKNVIVRINDRMPKHPERLIDLSLGTAKGLGMLEDGVIKVRIEVLRWGNE